MQQNEPLYFTLAPGAHGMDLSDLDPALLDAARAVLANDYLVRAVCEWIDRPQTGYDWQHGRLPHRIELGLRNALLQVNTIRAQAGATPEAAILDPACAASP